MHVNCEFKRYNIKCDVIKPLSLLKFDSHQISDPLCLVSLGGIAIEIVTKNSTLLHGFLEFIVVIYKQYNSYHRKDLSPHLELLIKVEMFLLLSYFFIKKNLLSAT